MVLTSRYNIVCRRKPETSRAYGQLDRHPISPEIVLWIAALSGLLLWARRLPSDCRTMYYISFYRRRIHVKNLTKSEFLYWRHKLRASESLPSICSGILETITRERVTSCVPTETFTGGFWERKTHRHRHGHISYHLSDHHRDCQGVLKGDRNLVIRRMSDKLIVAAIHPEWIKVP